MKTFDITTTEKPRWFQIRWRISNLFLRIAKWIYQENPGVWAFYLKQATDLMISGNAITRIDPQQFFKDKKWFV